MSFIIKKESGKLHYQDLGGYEFRNPSTFWSIQEADKIYNWDDFPELRIYTEDFEENEQNYTFSKQNSYNNLIPDFTFHNWPQVNINDYNETINAIDQAGLTNYEVNKVGWIGNINVNINRTFLVNKGNENKDIFDFIDMNWIHSGNVLLNATKYLSLPDLVKKYSILIDIEGRGFSARTKFLLWSHRPLIIVDRPHNEYFFEYLKEWEHFIPVRRDLSDLVEKTNWILNNYDKALEIAENAYKFSKKHLTREVVYAKWNEIITKFIENNK
jgi:hypothetical protein